MRILLKHYLLVIFFLFKGSCFAQLLSPYTLGVHAGTFIYQGDLAPSFWGSFRTPSTVVGLDFSKRLNTLFDLRLDFNFGKVKGDDALYPDSEYRKHRAFSFSSSIKELNVMGVLHPLGRNLAINPYFFIGVGWAFTQISRDYNSFNAAYFNHEQELLQGLEKDKAHSLPKQIPVMPIGAGLSFRLTKKFLLSSELYYRMMHTDYLDGFSQSVNPSENDHFSQFSIGIKYFFPLSPFSCPSL